MGKSKKKFWDERSRKLCKKANKYKKHGIRTVNKDNLILDDYKPDYVVDVPETFSFINNLEETAYFFNTILNDMKKAFLKSDFLIESSSVNVVTTDAIMYLIALMRNCKITKLRMYSFHGTYPMNEAAKNVYIESGLLKFVKSKSKELPRNNNKMSIMCGINSDSFAAGKMCNFVLEKFGVTKSYVKELYEVIIEMMSNVYYHAYNDEETMIPEWYIYAEHKGDFIKFIFLDTGLGIGKTVQKHSLYEKVINKIGVGSDSKLIISALNGDFRTQTGKKNHGKGLPYICEFAHSDKVLDFHIISGKGHCWLNKGGVKFSGEDLKNKINGTMYSFTIKRRIINEN